MENIQIKTKIRDQRFFSHLSVLLLFVCFRAEAVSTTFYSDRTTWQTAAGIHTDIGFEGLAGIRGYDYLPTPPGITISGVNFTIDHTLLPNNGSLYVLGPYFAYPGNSVLSAQQSQPGTDNILITFSQPVSAWAMDFGDQSGGGSVFGFKLSDGVNFTRTTPGYNGGSNPVDFVGVTSDTPITSVDIYRVTPGTTMEIDNVSFALAPVPEVASRWVTLLGPGLVFLSACWLKRRIPVSAP